MDKAKALRISASLERLRSALSDTDFWMRKLKEDCDDVNWIFLEDIQKEKKWAKEKLEALDALVTE